MNLKLAASLVAATAAITMLAGCPAGTPNVTPTPTPFTFATDSLLTGKVTFNGQPLEFADASYKPVMKVKEPGQNALSLTADLEQGQYFQFKSLTAGKAYQAVWDYTGAAPTKAADVNTIDVYVSDPATASAAAADPMVTMDLEWNVGMSPEFGSTVTLSNPAEVTFGFNKIQNLDAEYQVTVFNSEGSAVWSSPWGTATSVTWNGKDTAGTNTGNLRTAGKAFYNIKFRKKGGEYNGANFYGETQRIPLTIEHAS